MGVINHEILPLARSSRPHVLLGGKMQSWKHFKPESKERKRTQGKEGNKEEKRKEKLRTF